MANTFGERDIGASFKPAAAADPAAPPELVPEAPAAGEDEQQAVLADEQNMPLDSEQSIRRALLEMALRAHRDPDKALSTAMRMAEFVLQGDGAPEARAGAFQVAAKPNWLGADSRMSHGRWTPEQDDQVRQMWSSGLPVIEIAARLSRTPASINSRVRTLRLPKRRIWRADSDSGEGVETDRG